ncbi:MAG TPA: dTDP-4-dehydrorhamnose reductase [Vicinamibacterales bacterium]|nr:dTDP-4-dehydrorhamnose reductase [Vicinamibacterales bacterium]
MKVLVTGAAGHLGAAMLEQLARAHDVKGLARGELDITDRAAVEAAVAAFRPDAVVNCAAHNGVDRAEEVPVDAFQINAFAVQVLARAADRGGAAFVHFSTDFVFDGRADRPYTEEDRPGPLSVYGASKLVGEWLAREASRWYVLRVESLFGGPTAGTSAKLGSVGTVVAAIDQGREVPVFVDRVVSPTSAPEAAAATVRLLERDLPPGLYHCVNSGHCGWDELAREAARLLGREARLAPMMLETAALKARRPRYCALSNAKLAAAGITMSHWQDALREYVRARASQPQGTQGTPRA